YYINLLLLFFFFQAEDGIRDRNVTGVQTCALPIYGETVEFNDIKSSEERGIVIIHQELALSPFLSIAENIFLGNEIKKAGMIDWNATNAEAAKLMERVGLDEKDRKSVV